jgi:hypothetical protein
VNPKTKTILTVVLGLTWTGAAIFGGRALLNYESTPGKVGVVSSSWPEESAIHLAGDRPTLVMAVHPQCPCTQASVAELAQVVAQTQNKARVIVLFYAPQSAEGTTGDWMNTSLHRAVAQIPAVNVVPDVDGIEARRFGAETSGHTFLFDSKGGLLFNGGITASRGHSGENIGENNIVSMINNRTANQTRTLVFGCSLHERKQGAACLK